MKPDAAEGEKSQCESTTNRSHQKVKYPNSKIIKCYNTILNYYHAVPNLYAVISSSVHKRTHFLKNPHTVLVIQPQFIGTKVCQASKRTGKCRKCIINVFMSLIEQYIPSLFGFFSVVVL